jgi:hypothetical protein
MKVGGIQFISIYDTWRRTGATMIRGLFSAKAFQEEIA